MVPVVEMFTMLPGERASRPFTVAEHAAPGPEMAFSEAHEEVASSVDGASVHPGRVVERVRHRRRMNLPCRSCAARVGCLESRTLCLRGRGALRDGERHDDCAIAASTLA